MNTSLSGVLVGRDLDDSLNDSTASNPMNTSTNHESATSTTSNPSNHIPSSLEDTNVDRSNTTPTLLELQTAALQIHPSLKHQAEQQLKRRESKGSESGSNPNSKPNSFTTSTSTPIPINTVPSTTSIPPSNRDSFRHSFVEIDHPLANHRTSVLPAGPASIDELDGDESEEAQEAIIRANNTKAEPSLSQIIKTALTTATNQPAGPVTDKSQYLGSPPAVALAASMPLPPSPQPPIITPATAAPPPQAQPQPIPTTTISMARIVKLLNYFIFFYSKAPGTFRASPKSMQIQHRITSLAKIDYHVSVIANDSSRNGANTSQSSQSSSNGDSAFEYCNSYPLELLIFENEKTGPYGVGTGETISADGTSNSSLPSHTLQSRVNDSAVLKPLFRLSRFSRVHGRFVIPVILVHNKNICRSSTLAIQAEAIFNNIHSATKQMIGNFWDTLSGFGGGSSSSNSNGAQSSPSSQPQANVVQVGLEGQRAHDIQLLLHTATSYIEDLMVEHRKKKLGVSLTSSEKNEQWRYSHMKLNALPYPGCEFFAEYKSNSHSGLNLFFNWSQSFISSDLLLSNPPPMIPDEMLSCNGASSHLPPGTRRSQAQIEEEHEFQHTTEHHHADQEHKKRIKREKELLEQKTPNSPTAIETSVSPSSSVVSTMADEILDQLLSHSASSFDHTAMASTIAQDETTSANVTTSNSPSTIAASVTTSSTDSTTVSSPTKSPSALSSSTSQHATPSPQPSMTSFKDYKSWNILTLTKNYLLILLAHIADESPNSGVLVHCISGWDRTPLFVSLLRLTLWADGVVHRNLNAMQILYFTIGYDWMLFGHHLHNRLEKGEDVFYFCFDFLQYITNTKFSLQTAIEMRQRKRIVEAELHIERSATPSASPPAVAAPVGNNIPPRRSALTSALQQQQQQQQQQSSNGTNGTTGLPPLRKSVSDGSGTQSNSTLPQSITHSDDEERASLLVDGPGSYSPRLHSIPPVSTSYTASKPVPSLASFIIESHSGDQQGTKSSSSATNSPQPPLIDDSDATSTGLGASSTIPIPKRKSSKASPQPIDLPAPVLDSTNSPVSSNPVTPIISSRSFTHSDGLLESSAILPNSVTGAAASSGSHLSRVNSWTHIAPSTSAQQLNAIAATAAATTDHLQLPTTNGAKSTSNGSSNSSSTTSSSSATNGSTYSHLSDSAAAHASMLRCERLLEVRSLFMSAYHHVLPSTPPAGNSPHSKATAYAAAMRALAAQRRESTVVIEKEDVPIQPTTTSTTIPAAAPPTRSTSQSVTAAPVAVPITRAASSSGWFSS